MRLFFTALLTAFLISAPAFAQQAAQLTTAAKQAYIVDAETGQVLFAKNENERMPTSSMSKVLTSYVVFDALRSGKITLDQQFPVSEKAWRMQGSKMFVPLGGMVRVEDLIRGVVIQSGNDATIVLAEGVAGSEESFVDEMNRTAQKLGMKDSHFMNASGWPDPEHYSTAHDLTVLGLSLIRDFPDQYRYDSEKDFTYNNIKQGNRNPLLYKNIGADGIKTGHTEEGGYGLIGSAVRNGRRVVMVLNGMASMQERADESTRMMEWALANFKNVNILKNGDKVVDAPVAMGVLPSVPLIVQQDMKMTVPRMAHIDVKAQAVFKGPLEAPVKKGAEVGVIRLEMPGMMPTELPIVTAADVPRLGFFPAIAEKASRLLFGAPSKEAAETTADPVISTAPQQPAPAPAAAAPAVVTPAPAPVPAPAQSAPVSDLTAPAPAPAEGGAAPATSAPTSIVPAPASGAAQDE